MPDSAPRIQHLASRVPDRIPPTPPNHRHQSSQSPHQPLAVPKPRSRIQRRSIQLNTSENGTLSSNHQIPSHNLEPSPPNQIPRSTRCNAPASPFPPKRILPHLRQPPNNSLCIKRTPTLTTGSHSPNPSSCQQPVRCKPSYHHPNDKRSPPSCSSIYPTWPLALPFSLSPDSRHQ
ncbi:hypothetical protein N431DRAFT_439688 [Stipitochalara longipes BDJ]|nr:hypothetical protein N431DRAFT_439688 [Stipitochalara longipes BDJ]